MAKFLSEKWLKECKKTLQDSEEFKSEARNFTGDFIFSFEADDELAKTKRLFLSIQGGNCEEAVFLNGEPYPDADYRVSAPYSLWMRMIRGRGRRYGRLHLAQGKGQGEHAPADDELGLGRRPGQGTRRRPHRFQLISPVPPSDEGKTTLPAK